MNVDGQYSFWESGYDYASSTHGISKVNVISMLANQRRSHCTPSHAGFTRRRLRQRYVRLCPCMPAQTLFMRKHPGQRFKLC